MTHVQLPEVPAIARFNVTGDYCYPTVDDPEGSCVSYDDHAAQLREYATTDRANVLAAILAIIPGGSICDPQQIADDIRAILDPPETNSER